MGTVAIILMPLRRFDLNVHAGGAMTWQELSKLATKRPSITPIREGSAA